MNKITTRTFLLFLLSMSYLGCSDNKIKPLSAEMADQIKRLPANSAGLFYINLNTIRESPFYTILTESFVEDPTQHPEYQEFVQATGFDIKNDMDQIYGAYIPSKEDKKEKGLIIGTGRFNREKIDAFISMNDKDNKISRDIYGNYTLYQIDTGSGSGSASIYFCFVNDETVIGGDAGLVKSWLDNLDSEKDQLNNNLLKRIEPIRYKNGAWFTMDAQSLMKRIADKMDKKADLQQLNGIEAIKNVNFSINTNEYMMIHGESVFTDNEKAQLFHDAFKGILATIKLSLGSDRGSIDIINKLKIDTKQNKMVFECQINEEDIKKLISKQQKKLHTSI